MSTSKPEKDEEPQEIVCWGGITLPPLSSLLLPQPLKEKQDGE